MPAGAPGKPEDVSQLLLHYLKTENVKYLFGIPGAAHKNTLYTLKLKSYPRDFKFITCLHETGASYIAAGYYRATGRPGVVLVTSGPGATNALTGAVSAQFDGSAVITITGEPSEEFIGRGYLQEGVGIGLNIQDIYEAAIASSAYVTNPTSAKGQIERALSTLMSVPRNAVHLSIPNDVAEDLPRDKKKCFCPKDWPTPLPRQVCDYRTEQPGEPSSQDVKYASDVLYSRNRPLIFLGSGCRDALRWEYKNGQRTESKAYAALRTLVNDYHIPVLTSMDGKGLFPETDFHSLGAYGPAALTWPRKWFRDPEKDPENREESWYDALLVIGSSLGKFATDQWNAIMLPNGPFIQVDIDTKVMQRAFGGGMRGIVADAGKFIEQISKELKGRSPPNEEIDARKKYLEKIKSDGKDQGFVDDNDYRDPSQWSDYEQPESHTGKIETAALIRVLQEAFLNDKTTDAMLFIDSGNCVGWAGHYFKVDPPNEWHSSLSVAAMGVAVGGVIGARLGINQLEEETLEQGSPQRKETVCFALVGDGAFLMHANEILGARLRKLGAIWIVLKDIDLLMVTQGQNSYAAYYKQNPNIKHDGDYKLGNDGEMYPNFVKICEGYGAKAYEVDTLKELKEKAALVIKGAQGNMPQVIVVNIDRKKAPPYTHLLKTDRSKTATQEEFENDKSLRDLAIEIDKTLLDSLRS